LCSVDEAPTSFCTVISVPSRDPVRNREDRTLKSLKSYTLTPRIAIPVRNGP